MREEISSGEGLEVPRTGVHECMNCLRQAFFFFFQSSPNIALLITFVDAKASMDIDTLWHGADTVVYHEQGKGSWASFVDMGTRRYLDGSWRTAADRAIWSTGRGGGRGLIRYQRVC